MKRKSKCCPIFNFQVRYLAEILFIAGCENSIMTQSDGRNFQIICTDPNFLIPESTIPFFSIGITCNDVKSANIINSFMHPEICLYTFFSSARPANLRQSSSQKLFNAANGNAQFVWMQAEKFLLQWFNASLMKAQMIAVQNVILHGRRLFLNSVGFDPRFPDFFLEIVKGRIVPEKTESIEPGIA